MNGTSLTALAIVLSALTLIALVGMPGLNRRLKVRASQAENVAPGDMRETLVDNPLDWREDGSILEGDPAWAALMDVMNTGEAASFTQNADGTWAKGV